MTEPRDTGARYVRLLTTVLFVVAVLAVLLRWIAPEDVRDVRTAAEDRERPSAHAAESASPDEEPTAGAGAERTQVRTESAVDGAEDPHYHRVRVFARCADGTPIESATVTLGVHGKSDYWQSETTGVDGRAMLRTPKRIGVLEALVVRGLLPGVVVEQPLAGLDPAAEVELVFDAVGWLEARIEGEFRGAGMQVVAVVDGEANGPTCTRKFDEPSERMAVGSGRDYRVHGWQGGEKKWHAPLRGPEQPGAVVTVDFDFRRVRVAFRLPEGDAGEQLAAMQLTKTRCTRCDVASGDDGSFTVLVPLATEAWFVLARMAESFETGPRPSPMRSTSGSCDSNR